MASYTTIRKDSMEYLRDLLRNDSTLMVSILGLSGTTASIQHVFAGRPKDRTRSDGKPFFKKPRFIVDNAPSPGPSKLGDNADGYNDSTFNYQISGWVTVNEGNSSNWDLTSQIQDRIRALLHEDDGLSVTNGYSKFKIVGEDDFLDPDMNNTRQVNILVEQKILGG